MHRTKGNLALVATNLNFPSFVNNSNTSGIFEQMESVRILANYSEVGPRCSSSTPSLNHTLSFNAALWTQEMMMYPRYFTMDAENAVLLWSDTRMNAIKYYMYHTSWPPHIKPSGTSFRAHPVHGAPTVPFRAYGIAIDRGLGPPMWDNHLDCYGNGVCLGWAGECAISLSMPKHIWKENFYSTH